MGSNLFIQVLCYAFGVLSIISCIAFCCVRATKASVLSLAIKTLSSVFFILCGVFSINYVGSSTMNLLIIVGLVFGLVGDIILDLKVMYPEDSDKYFVFGTSSFIFGHIFYFASVFMYNKSVLESHLLWNILISLGVAIVLTLVILLSSKKMGMDFKNMKSLVAFYSLLLTFMVAYSVSIAIYEPIFWIFAAGMIVFFLSDLVLSMQYFGGRNQKVWIYVNHILYYLAQVTLAISILFLA